jgi:hypothetical protein
VNLDPLGEEDDLVTAWRVIASSTPDKKLADAVPAKAEIATAATDGEDQRRAQGKPLALVIAELVAKVMKVVIPEDESIPILA